MGFSLRSNRRSWPAGPTRSAAGRRKGRRCLSARKKVGRPCCRRWAAAGSEEEAVAEKLQALKELMPSSRRSNGGEQEADGSESAAADRLFEEAASYIILLKSRVDVLQKLVDLYGSGEGRTSVS